MDNGAHPLEVAWLLDRYRALAETSASVLFAADVGGSLTDIPLLRGLAITEEKRGLGLGWLEAMHPDDRKGALDLWETAVKSGKPYQAQFRLHMAGGHYRWHLTKAVLVYNKDGSRREWIGSCVDVHQQVSRERILRLLDDFTMASREMQTYSDVVICGQRMLGETLSATRVAYGELREGGKSMHTVPNYCVGCEDLDGKLPVSGFSSPISNALRNGQLLICNDVAANPELDGGSGALVRAQIVSMVTYPVMKDGKTVAILGVHHAHAREWSEDEIEMVQTFAERLWSEAERVRAEQELLTSARRQRSILDAATVGVIVNNSQGVFLFANPPLLKMLGYTREEVLAGEVTWSRIQDANWSECDLRAYEELGRSGTCEPYETMLVRKDGSKIHVFVGAAIVEDQGGSEFLGAAFVTDLTPLKNAEDELRELNFELEKRVDDRTAELKFANHEMEGFTYSVSHDLRAPLRSIVATSRILLEDAAEKLSDQEKSLLEQQARSATRLGVLIDDLLKLSRLGRDEFVKSQFDLSKLAESVWNELLPDEQCQVVEIEIEPDLKGYGDPRHIQLLLLNLLDNACKFSPNGGKVRVGQQGGAFFVSDQGIGFDMAYAEKLFLPFERLVREADFPGTGVGLANVHRIVERHGGNVWAESEPGHGATFYFTLPP
jgi:PAS domain S-box-containing protein